MREEAQRPRNPLPLSESSLDTRSGPEEIKSKAEGPSLREKERERRTEREGGRVEEARKEKDETSIEVFLYYVRISTDKNRCGCFCTKTMTALAEWLKSRQRVRRAMAEMTYKYI